MHVEQHQEQKQNSSPNAPAGNKQPERGEQPREVCPSACVYHRLPKDHVQGGRRAEPGRHRGLAGGILAASAPMALVTQHQIQKVRSRWEAFLGKRSVSPAQAVPLLVRHGCYSLVLAGSSGDLLL